MELYEQGVFTMKTGIFYRVQSTKYDVSRESISWHMRCDTVEKAMELDIFRVWGDSSKFYAQQIQKLKLGAPVKEIWGEFIKEGYKSECVQPGLSCYEDFGRLLEFWEDRMGLDRLMDEADENYIVIFEGEYVGEGSSGEDCVKFIREIERVGIGDLEPIIELWLHGGERGRELILYGGHESIEELLEAVNRVCIEREDELYD